MHMARSIRLRQGYGGQEWLNSPAEALAEAGPCRVLALEEARRGKDSLGGLPVKSGLESWHRLEHSQQSSGECVGELARSWWARIATGIEDALD
jgi:hypothetical protein